MTQNSTLDAAPYVGIQSRQPPDPQRFPAAHAGWFLKRERLSRGLALNKVAAHLKIRERYLWAIEEGVDAEFPQASNFFSYVAAYAQYLGFDSEPLIEHYRQIMPAMLEAQKRGPGNIIALWPAMRARARPLALAVIVFVAVLAGAGLWFVTDPSPEGSKIATIPVPADLDILKKRDVASQQGDNPTTTASLPASAKNILGAGSIRVRTKDLTEALENSAKPTPPLNRSAVEAELDAAVNNN
jgi:cytoskeletal protein RodZ